MVLDGPAKPLLRDIQFNNMRPLVDVLGGRVDVLPADRSPLQHGFIPLFELVFVTENNQRPPREREPKIRPYAADRELQVTSKIKRRHRQRPVISAGVIVITAPAIHPSTNKAKICLRPIQLEL